MAEIHSTKLLTLPDGSYIELRVVPQDHEDEVSKSLLTDLLQKVSELEGELNTAAEQASEASGNAESIEIDNSAIVDAVREAAESAVRDTDIEYRSETEDACNDTVSTVESAQGTLEEIERLIKEAMEPTPKRAADTAAAERAADAADGGQ